jgi:hypothetical protein
MFQCRGGFASRPLSDPARKDYKKESNAARQHEFMLASRQRAPKVAFVQITGILEALQQEGFLNLDQGVQNTMTRLAPLIL